MNPLGNASGDRVVAVMRAINEGINAPGRSFHLEVFLLALLSLSLAGNVMPGAPGLDFEIWETVKYL